MSSGIRHGCMGSTSIFKLVTYEIMQDLEKLDKGYKDDNFNITSLFFADNGMLLASSIEDAEKVIEQVIKTGRENGLEINKGKCEIIIFNMKQKPKEIAGIEVKNKTKYLGVTINDAKNLFKVQKPCMIKKATKMSNITYSIVARSCARLMIGKVYWKSIALPMILYGANVINFTQEDIQKLQRIENSVGRKIMGAPSYTQETALRGEIGISSMKSRIMEGQLKYLQHILRGESNRLLERVVEEMRNDKKKNKWMGGLIEDRKRVGIRGIDISKQEISEKVKKWDKEKWRNDMQEKESLKIYRQFKTDLGGMENIYDNSEASVILFKCRTNNMNLGDRKRFINQSTECVMCGHEKEDLTHFLLYCDGYSEERAKNTVLQRPYIENEENLIGQLLFENSVLEQSKLTIYKFWQIRDKKIKSLA